MPKEPIGKLDHIGIAVRSLVEARKFWEGVMGAKFMYDAENPRAGYKLLELDLNGLIIELLEPLGADSFLYRYLEKKGEGMHHLTFALPDVKKTASELRDAGMRVVDEIEYSPTSHECFISPRSSHGVLIQLGSGYPTLANDAEWTRKK